MTSPIDDLWRQVAESPEDLGIRLVLADALAENGDARGELIHLQCADHPEARAETSEAITRLINENWTRWLGDLALVLRREGTWFHRGMLDVVHVGQTTTPEWAFERVAGHRELSAVRAVRPAHVEPARYARFISGLPRDPVSLGVHSALVFDALGERRFATRTLRFGSRRAYPAQLAAIFDGLDQMFPELAELELLSLSTWWDAGRQLLALVPELPYMFPQLESVAIYESSLIEDQLGGEGLAPLLAMPIVSLR